VEQWAQQKKCGTIDWETPEELKRLITMAAQFAQRPNGSSPDQTENRADLKVAYRFLDNKNVSQKNYALSLPAWRSAPTPAPDALHLLVFQQDHKQ
jgi:hypothetical protein